MDIVYTSRVIEVRELPFFDLDDTLNCGQAFRFFPDDEGGWQGIVRGRQIRMTSMPGGVRLEGCDRQEFDSLWRHYLDLDRDYGAIRRGFLSDPTFGRCAQYAPGIHILRQEAWEALISFIISQNNNVPRIKGIVQRLCEGFGEPVPGGYAFPVPQRLAKLSEEDLSPLRAGWRAAYILDAARQVADGRIDLDAIEQMPLKDTRAQLQKIKGVGLKVAECVLLYGMGRMEAFPLDVWMKRAMATLFPGRCPEDFGPYAGIAQQYIFNYSRMEKIG
jgi:N-glycosylase/DNA lyase